MAFLGAIGAVVSALGTVAGGIATASSASYQAQVAENNAKIARQNAIYSEQAGALKTEQTGLQGAEQVGAARTALAANNTDVNTGSALDVQVGTREKSDINEQTIANNAELQAYGYRNQAQAYSEQAQLDQMEASEAIPGALIGATGSLLSNASSLSAKWGGDGGTAAALPGTG